MLIISQDKCTIVNFDNIKTIELDEEKDFKSIIIFRETDEVETGVCGLIIGHYTTKERAKEVLQEIIETYLACNEQSVLANYAYVKNEVYEMPAD